MFGNDREVRLRPHFFPFTEPSVEVDVSCFNCARDGSPCRVCRAEGWVEILGAGMVDPNLFDYVEGYDTEELTGYAWGMGVERIAAACATPSPTSGCSGRTTCGSWSSSDEGAGLVAARVRRRSTCPCPSWVSCCR